MRIWRLEGCWQEIAIRLTAYFANATTILFSIPAEAQIVPDATLPVNSIVTPNGNTLTIEGGSRAGGNLFHSFTEFSLTTGSEAFFNNAADVQNIFTRITGSNISNIDGLIRANGTANLFLLNPNGIIFGPNAQLNIGGSFVGSTANSIKFADSTDFSATNPTVAPLLTISVPIGLQMGQNPGAIQNASRIPSPSPYTSFFVVPGGLQVPSGNSLILLGGDVSFEGGGAGALKGQIEVGAVGANSFVAFVPRNFGFELNYDTVQTFRDVRLDRLSVLDARDGGVQLRGRQINVLNSSQIVTNLSEQTSSRGIAVTATESLKISGFTQVQTSRGIFPVGASLTSGVPQTLTGTGGNISLKAPTIIISDTSFVSVGVGNFGQGGNITIQANQLSVLDGSQVGASTNGAASSGNLIIEAADVELSGLGKLSRRPAVLYTVVNSGTGQGGTLNLQTERLRISDGAVIAANTFGEGNAGNTIIHASDFVEISNANKESIIVTGIISDATATPGFPQNLQGNGGSIELTTGRLIVRGGGTIGVGNAGTGDAGNLTINAGSVTLNEGILTASIAQGKEGNIRIDTNVLLMRNNSQIITNAQSQANGGNITINSPIVVGLENSDIIANAVQGRGGNIQISTQGIFGLQNRSQLTPQSDITASSEFGLSGTINVSVLNVNQQNVFAPPPSNFVSTDQVAANSCLARSGNRQATLAIAGNGGLPETPETATIPYEVVQVRAAQNQPAQSSFQQLQGATPTWKFGDPIVEATEFSVNAQGQVVLTAKGNSAATANAHPHPIPCQPN